MIYWEYGNLSMIGMLLNNICEIWNHNISNCKTRLRYIFWKIYDMGRIKNCNIRKVEMQDVLSVC